MYILRSCSVGWHVGSWKRWLARIVEVMEEDEEEMLEEAEEEKDFALL